MAIIRAWLAAALLCAAIVLAGCQRRAAVVVPVVSEEGRFPHERHAGLTCTACHDLEAVLAGRPAMPGTRDHAPCDDSGCHQEAFTSAPGPLCESCHEAVDPVQPAGSPLRPYPPERGRRSLASAFSHRLHLDFALMEREVGFHVVCSDCHATDEQDTPAMPDHAVCGRCHAPEAAPPGAPGMNRCAFCHQPRAGAPGRQRRFIVGDLHFRHQNHVVDRRGVPTRCVECHQGSPEADTVGTHPIPSTRSCVGCHDDTERVPPAMRMRMCETCHLTRAQRISSLAPRSHLPPTERPEDHTLAFRRDHAGDADRDAARCGRCHTFMSGTAQNACDECHQVMPPQDHMITWRELEHGPAASVRADRCATCHTGTFCAACHSRAPRSHFPLQMFRGGGHAPAARLGLRACLTCHDPEASCAGCHVPAGASRNGPAGPTGPGLQRGHGGQSYRIWQ